MPKLPIVTLRGGLGNQLFQLSFQLASYQGQDIFLDVSTSYSRESERVDLLNFVLPERVKIFRNPNLETKTSKSMNSRLLRLGLLIHKKRYLLPALGMFEFLGLIYYSLYLKGLTSVQVAVGNGFDARLKAKNFGNSLNIGFFQSYKWVLDQSVRTELSDMRLVQPSRELLDLIKIAEFVNPLIVHVRLGDYLNDPARGIPAASYYHQGIKSLLESNTPREIWIFSDDQQLAREYLQLENPNLRWFSKVNDSDVETFELMRYGKSYLIGNSTFSWWAATLSYSLNPEVIAPSPWFIDSPVPQDLIWEKWKTRPAWDI